MSNAESEIAARINRWAFDRDQQSWEALLDAFHDDGVISLSWFDGPYAGFVAASQRMAAVGRALVKHRLGVPAIRVRGGRALSEVDVAILVRAQSPFGEIDTTTHARFFDWLERRTGVWRLLRRTAIYEKDQVAPVCRPSLPAEFFAGLERFPAEVRFLAASLERAGAALVKGLVLDGSPAARDAYREGEAWLAAAGER